MTKNTKKISDDELSVVTGGVNVDTKGCEYFKQADGKLYVKICGNCIYFNQKEDGNKGCTIENVEK